jgi:hypothetical protein
MRRYWPAVVLGAAYGVPLGLWAGNWGSAPGFAGLAVVIPLVIAGLGVALGLLTTALARSRAPLVATLAVVAGFGLGYFVAPGAPGSTQRVSGTGAAGTRTAPASLWSGPVSCEWPKDESMSVVQVRGYDVPVSDPLLLAKIQEEQGGPLAVEVRIQIVEPAGTIYLEDSYADGSHIGGRFPVEMVEVAPDGRAGTAVLREADPDLLFNWDCLEGP